MGARGTGLELRGGRAQASEADAAEGREDLGRRVVGEGRQKKVDWQRLMPPRDFKVLPRRRWVVERAFWWLSQNRRMSKD